MTSFLIMSSISGWTAAWQGVGDRFDLQTDIWRGRILRTVRDREKARRRMAGVPAF